jgi:retron-type reverse transcriptase
MAETAVINKVKKLLVARASRLNNFDNNSNFNANNRNVDNHNALRGIAHTLAEIFLKMNRDLWKELCSYENLFLAYKKARKHKTTKNYVIEFEKDLEDNLLILKSELLLHSYNPKPLVNFIIRDPKTRKISKSDFRDGIIHHALVRVIETIFDKSFIYDSCANRIGKGNLFALKRFDLFKRKATKNNSRTAFCLKADIKHYFQEVNHQILLKIIRRKIKDENVIWLIKQILRNFLNKERGMPLGNLTSQFFANVYLNELDKYVKHKLKVKYYIRYVDDFVILDSDKTRLKKYKNVINQFLKQELNVELHPDKSNIISIGSKLTFLGFRVFYYHKLLKKSNLRNMRNKFEILKQDWKESKINYDDIYDFFEGWIAYAKQANTYTLRKRIAIEIEKVFPNEISTKEINRVSKAL